MYAKLLSGFVVVVAAMIFACGQKNGDLLALRGGSIACYKPVVAQRCNLSREVDGEIRYCTAVSSYSIDPNSKNLPGANVSYLLVEYCFIPNTMVQCGSYVTGYADCVGDQHPGELPPIPPS